MLFFWIWQQIPWAEAVIIFKSIPLLGLLGLIALDILIVLIMSGRWWFILQGLGVHSNYFQTNRYRLAATAVSYFTPGPQFGGEPLQVWVLTHHHNVENGTAVASVTVDKLIELIANFAILILGMMIVLRTQFEPNQAINVSLSAFIILWVIFFLILLGLMLGYAPLSNLFSTITKLFFLFNSLKAKKWVLKISKVIKDSEKKILMLHQRAPKRLALAWLITFLNWILWFVEFWTVYALLGLPMNWGELFFALTTARLAFLLPSPTGLGTFEASQYFAMSAIGHPVAIGLSATLLMRIRDTLLAGLGLWFVRQLISKS